MTNEEACQALSELQTRLKLDAAPALAKLPLSEIAKLPSVIRLQHHLEAIDYAIAVLTGAEK